MDSNIIIAVASIAGALVGIIGTYFVQARVSGKQRKWALEDEERREEREREMEQRRIKRELLCKRLDVVEEAVKIMMIHIKNIVAKEDGEPDYDTSAELKKQKRRLQITKSEVWAALVALESEDLMKHWTTIFLTYSNLDKSGWVDRKLWADSHLAYPEIIKLTDEMRSRV